MSSMTDIIRKALADSPIEDTKHGNVMYATFAFRSGGQYAGMTRLHEVDGYFVCSATVAMPQGGPPGTRPNTPLLMQQIFHGDDVERFCVTSAIEQPLIATPDGSMS